MGEESETDKNHKTKLLNETDEARKGNHGNDIKSKDTFPVGGQQPETQLFAKRWLMLLIFSIFSLSTAYQWIHLNIIFNIMVFYYNTSLPEDSLQKEAAIDWLSLVYMLAYIPTIVPAMLLLDKKGLRINNIVGSLLNAVGAWIKVIAMTPDRYPVLMCGQVFAAIGEVFAVSIPPRIAAVWFGPNEVSTATSIGVFGNQLGVAVGFLIPPILVRNSDDVERIGAGLSIMLYGTAAVCTLIFILMLIVYQKEPPIPPSRAQMIAKQITVNHHYREDLLGLARNKNFVLLAISYGLITGSYYALSTLLNPIILFYFEGEEQNAGRIGLTIVLTGIVGSIVAGLWLDKTKTFKPTSLGIYALSLLGMAGFTVIMYYDLQLMWVVYVISGFLGFFMTGYLPVGYEFAAEICYPQSEGTSSGILTASAMFFGMVLTLGMRAVMNRVSILAANITLSAAIFVGVILTALVKPYYRRQEAEKMVIQKYDHMEYEVKAPDDSDETREITLAGLSSRSPNLNMEMRDLLQRKAKV